MKIRSRSIQNLVSPFTYSYKCNSQLSSDMTRYQIISRINHQLGGRGGKFPTDVTQWRVTFATEIFHRISPVENAPLKWHSLANDPIPRIFRYPALYIYIYIHRTQHFSTQYPLSKIVSLLSRGKKLAVVILLIDEARRIFACTMRAILIKMYSRK